MPHPFETIEINDPKTASACVIWLHGLGATADDFVDIVPQLDLPDTISFIFPQAPLSPITINNGFMMPGWFDILGFGPSIPDDETGLNETAHGIEALIESQTIPSNKLVLAGFSQGGAMALHVGLRYSKPLAGILVLSGYLALRDQLATQSHVNNKDTAITMLHGLQDTVVLPEWAKGGRDILLAQDHPVSWHLYEMGHAVCEEEIIMISHYLKQWLL